jgi:hypothetical protein
MQEKEKIMKPTAKIGQTGVIGYILLWLLGVPISILFADLFPARVQVNLGSK